jgi:hypothetical protein
VRQDIDRLGRRLGSYPVSGVAGGVLQIFRRFVVGACAALVVCLVAIRPSSTVLKIVVTIAVAVGLLGLRAAWQRVSARLGLRRCYVHTGGLVVTNLFGQVTHTVAWSETTALKRLSAQSVFMTFQRVEIVRRDARPLAFLALGLKPALVEALLIQAAEHGLR